MKPLSGRHGLQLGDNHSWSSWTVALVFSLALNIVLFGSMTGLIDCKPRRPEYFQHLEKVNFIRIKRPESPIHKREKRPEIRSPRPEKDLTMKESAFRTQPLKQIVKLPFEINPELSAVSGTLPVLPIERVAIGPSGLGHIYGMSEIDHPLTPYVQVPPIYPMEARRRGIEGWVKVRFVVMEDGRVGDIEIMDRHPGRIFDRAVIRCISAWRFSPGTVEGVPVKTRVETTVRFELQK